MNQVFWGRWSKIGLTEAHHPALFTFVCFILRLHSILGTCEDSVLATYPFFHWGKKKKVIHNPPNNSALFVQCDKAKGAFTI